MSTRIIDYSHADYIPILDGDAIIWKEYGYISHYSNLTLYNMAVDETRTLLDQFPESQVKKILYADIGHMDTLLSTLNVHHRHARSLNILGTALKVVAGTPDFDDFEKLKLNQDQLIQSNNRQIEINTKIQIQISKLTDALNAILSNRKEQIDTGNLFEVLLSRNRMIIIELQNLLLSIALAKINVVNTIILDREDFNGTEHFTNISISELMQVSDIKVYQNNELLLFIIKFPNPELLCKKISVFPVPHSGKVIDLGDTNVVAECQKSSYTIDKCKPTVTSVFCNVRKNVTCAQQLISGQMAHCQTKLYKPDPVMRVDEGVIIINDAVVTVREPQQDEKLLTGTYLIIFDDYVNINNSQYVNKYKTPKRTPGTPTFPLINVTGHKNVLSLPFLHEMSLENLNHIGELKTRTKTWPIYSGCIAFTSFVVFYATILLMKRWCKRRQQLNLEIALNEILRKTEDGLHLSEGRVNTGC